MTIPVVDARLIVAMFMVTVFPGLLAVLARAFVRVRYDQRLRPFIVAADILIFISFVASIWYCCGMSLLVIYGIITVGSGIDGESRFIDNGTTIKALKIGYATGNVYYLGLYCAKGAMIALLWGIIPNTRKLHRKFLYLATAFVAICGVFTIVFNVFACWPIQNNWVLGPANCYAYRLPWVLIPSSALQLATDLVLVALPLPLLHNLRVSTRQKVGLAFIFCLGFFCIFSTMMRLILVYGPNIKASDGGYSLVWSGIEMSTGICVACAPAVRTFAARNKSVVSSGSWRIRKSKDRTNSGVAELDRSPHGFIELRAAGRSGAKGMDDSDSTKMTKDGEVLVSGV